MENVNTFSLSKKLNAIITNKKAGQNVSAYAGYVRYGRVPRVVVAKCTFVIFSVINISDNTN